MLIDMRDAFFDAIYSCVEKDENVIVLTADHGAFGLSRIQKDFPKQYINVGIAEQNMISVAAGLAKCGKIVYVYSINNFISLRSLEQVNIDLCAMNLHVNLVGVGAGFTYSTDGPTHQGVQDMQAMRVLPNMQIYNVTDHINSKELALLGYKQNGPKYFRIEKGRLPMVYSEDDTFYSGFSLLEEPKETVVISTGYMTHIANSVSEVNEKICVLDLYRIKPIDEKSLANVLKRVKNIVVLEEGTSDGGLCEKISFIMAKNSIKCSFLAIHIEEQHCHYYGTREMLHKKFKIDLENVNRRIKKFLENK